MRRIARFENEHQANQFFRVLLGQKIDAFLEKEEEGFEIWIKNEDQITLAEKYYQNFLENKEPPPLPEGEVEQEKKEALRPPEEIPIVYAAPLSRFFIFICAILFFVALYQGGQMKEIKDPVFPRFLPIQQNLLYDYPVALIYAEELMEKYELTKDTDVMTLPIEGQDLIQKIRETPPWEGFYAIFTNWGERKELLKPRLFSDIREGEVWRVVTPTILHVDFLHFLFNMLWLWLLGRMVEKNMHFLSYLIFVLVVAVITNTLQYLMTGPFFMGFSGVVSAMAGYIWVRKKKAPWEIYPVDFATLIFLWIFIFGMLALQIVAFFLEILHIVSFPLNIANTAHVSGVILGFLFGRVVKRKAI